MISLLQRRYVLAVSLAIGSPLSAQENVKQDIAKIAGMPNSIERLAAFDALAVKLGVAPGSNVAAERSGKWNVRVETSPIDDSQIVTAMVVADQPIGDGLRATTPSLFLRFKEGDVNAFVTFDRFLGSDNIDVTLRFGKEPAINQSWSISTNHTTAFCPIDHLNDFLKHLGENETFLIRLTPFSESPVIASFTVSGSKKAIAAIKAAEAKATTSQPKIEPIRPRQRPQVVMQQQVRPAIFQENKFGTQNIGSIAYDAKWSNYGQYLQKMIETVQIQWERILKESRVSAPSGTNAKVVFRMNMEGRISQIVSVDGTAGNQAEKACTSAITARVPYGPWTDDMIAVLGESQELTFTFFYQ